jgi:hypothetical protein
MDALFPTIRSAMNMHCHWPMGAAIVDGFGSGCHRGAAGGIAA